MASSGIKKVPGAVSDSFIVIPPGFGHHSKFFLTGIHVLTGADNPANVRFLLAPHSKFSVSCLPKRFGGKIGYFSIPRRFPSGHSKFRSATISVLDFHYRARLRAGRVLILNPIWSLWSKKFRLADDVNNPHLYSCSPIDHTHAQIPFSWLPSGDCWNIAMKNSPCVDEPIEHGKAKWPRKHLPEGKYTYRL